MNASRPVASRPAWWRPTPDDLVFAVRTATASLVALYLALFLQMEAPRWAAMTVFVVAQGDRGAALSKSWGRVAGTLLGATAATVLMALFAQAPELYLLTLSLWLALCTGVATVLPGSRSYGAVLAGYTAVIVGMSASGEPGQVFEIAVARSTEVVLGIVVAAVFAALFSPRSPLPRVQQRLETYLRQGNALCARLLRGEPTADEVHRFFVTALQFNEMVLNAAAASRDVARGLPRIRRISYLVLSQLVAAQACRDALEGRCATGLQGVIVLLERRSRGEVVDDREWQAIRRELAVTGGSLASSLVLERGRTILGYLQAVRWEHDAFVRGEAASGGRNIARHRDVMLATRNAVRALMAFAGAALFWLHSGWGEGATLVTLVGVVCSLYSTRPDPVAGGIGFLKGAACALLAVTVYDCVLMPHVSSFAGLVLVVAPLLLLGALGMRRPGTAAIGAAGSIFFLDLLAPLNGSFAEPVRTFNGGIALLLGIAIGVVVFTVLLPADFSARLRRLRATVLGDLGRLARHPERFDRRVWFERMADRLRHQFSLSRAEAGDRQRSLAAMLGALAIGAAVIELARLAPVSQRERAAWRWLVCCDFTRLQRSAERMMARELQLARCQPETDSAAAWRRAVLWHDIAQAARLHGDSLLQALPVADAEATGSTCSTQA